MRLSSRPPSIRRKRRLARELKALEAMRGHLRTREIVWAAVSIPALVLLCLIVAIKLHWMSESPAVATGGALAAGMTIWWIGRQWFTLATLIVMGLMVIVFEDAPDLDGFGGSDDRNDRKAARREKLERAIARREALLGRDGAPSHNEDAS